MIDNNINHIYDKLFKKVLTMSEKAVINFINGLFDTDYPTDAKLTYNWTEFHDEELHRTLADTLITINDRHTYHIEAQSSLDKTIVFRVFDYGYRHALLNKEIAVDQSFLRFPEPKIIYIYAAGKIPDKHVLTLDFGSQGTFAYEVGTMQLSHISVEELNQRKMIILIPFYLLSLQKTMEKDRTPKTLEQLKQLIFHDILGSIDENRKLGNITDDDAHRLKELSVQLYHHLYAKYQETEEVTDMTDESIILEYDRWLKKYNIESLDDTLEKARRAEQLELEKKALTVENQQLKEQAQQADALKTENQQLKEQAQRADALKTENQQLKKDIQQAEQLEKQLQDSIRNTVKNLGDLGMAQERVITFLIDTYGLSKEQATAYVMQ